jgi:pimeloyl-ACP methyl ester carboxylesterase
MKLSFSEVALGFCRHARALHPSYETAWFSEAALLGRLGRGHEFEAFKDMFRQRFGEDGLFNKLKDVVATDMRTREQRTRDFLARDGVAERFGKTVGVETRLSDALVEGTHWRHFPATGERPRTLAIFYAPVELRPPTLPYFRTVGAIACASLLINPGTNNFFQDCIESTTEIIHRVCRRHGYEETIHFGYSMGATAALRFGTADPLCRAIFALSPHLVLDRPFSRTADLMNPKLLSFDPERSRETSLLSRLENCPAREIHLFISCLDPQDGVQVRDALSLRQGPAQAHFLMEHHFLASIHRPADMIGDWLRNGRYTLPSDAPLASPIDQRAAIAAYDAMAAARDKEAVAIDDDLEMARTPTLPFCRAVALLSQDKPEQAWLFAAQALEGPLSLVGNLYGVLTTARRSAALLGWNEIAVGYYVEARSREPWYEEAWLLEASSLASAGRQGALEALLSDCRILHGDKALLATLSEIAASAVPSQAL